MRNGMHHEQNARQSHTKTHTSLTTILRLFNVVPLACINLATRTHTHTEKALLHRVVFSINSGGENDVELVVGEWVGYGAGDDS